MDEIGWSATTMESEWILSHQKMVGVSFESPHNMVNEDI